jgi:hypothetical protein
MVAFEVRINGERRYEGEHITSVTLAADWVYRRQSDRVSIHVGGSQVHALDARLQPGDEVVIRIVDAAEDDVAAQDGCTFCGSASHEVTQLIQAPTAAICDVCVAAFDAVLKSGAKLPLGATLRDDPNHVCSVCGKIPGFKPGEIPGVFVRNEAAICAECLHACSDIMADTAGPEAP